MKCLVAGWFSFEQMGATAGDLIARDIVCEKLREAGIPFDIAIAPPFKGGINWKEKNPAAYTDILFVCGPFGNGWPVNEFLEHFSGARFTGVNLSMLESLDTWNPFTHLFERDSSAAANPDITLYAPAPNVPVIGLILSHKQKEYGNRSLHEQVNKVIDDLLGGMEAAVIPIDTALENNAGGLRTPGEVEAVIARMDLVVTTRLHGTVLALKNGVPVVPVDPVAGGAKITAQVKTIGWPVLFNAGDLVKEELEGAVMYCLSGEAREKARQCAARAKERVAQTLQQLVNVLQKQESPGKAEWNSITI